MAVIVISWDFFAQPKIRAIEQVSQGCRWLAAGHIKSDQVQRRAECFKRRFLTPSLSHPFPLSLSQEGAHILYFRGSGPKKRKKKSSNQSFILLSPSSHRIHSQNISSRKSYRLKRWVFWLYPSSFCAGERGGHDLGLCEVHAAVEVCKSTLYVI